jgi:hypothetical protein
MSTQVAIRRGNTAQTAAFTGVVAELTVDTDKKVVVVHDGTTAGGNPLVKANASITTGQILTSNGSQLIAIANTGTAGTYGNASFIPVVTTDAYGRVSSVTNTAIAISSGVVTGVMTFTQGGANATSYTTGGLLTSNGTSFVSVANTGTAGTYGNAAFHPVITTDAYGRVSAVTNTAIAIDTAAITSGTLADARLPTKGTAGTYANATYVPVITTDAYGRVTSVTNTAISFPVISVGGSTGAVSNIQLLNSILTVDGTGSGLDADLLNGFSYTAFANATFANTRFSSSGGSITGDVTVTGNLTIVGQTVYANTTTALIADNILTLNAAIGQASAPTVNAGIEVDRGSSANVLLLWNESTDKWQFTNDGSIYYDIADAGRLDSVFSLANGTAGVANTDYTTISTTAGVYGNSAFVPVTTLTANGRVSSITNTAIAIDTSAITSGTIADARLPTKGTAGTYANAAYVPVITTDAYGRVTGITNTAIAISATVVSGIHTFAQGGTNAASYTTGTFLTSNGTAFVSVANTGTAGTYANAAYVPVITTDAYGRVSSITNTSISIDTAQITSGTIADARLPTKGTAGTYANAAYVPVVTTDAYGRVTAVTNTLVQISASQVTSGILPFAQGGANATTYTTGGLLTSNGTSFVSVANTGTAGTYANASYIPVITTDAYGRVSSVTNTAVSIDTSQITSGTIADARLAATGTAGTYANAAYVPVITTDSKGRVTAITNTAIAIDTSQITSGTVADARLPTKGTAGTYANAAYIPVITTDAYGRVTGVTNTAVAIDTSQLTSGTVADARLPTKGTAGTYANSTYIPVITTDAYGRVTAITNTVIQSSTTSVQGIVQLTDSISSTSTTTAATPNSVKTAYDLAATKFNSSGGTISGDTTITGNLVVNGTTTTVNTSTVSTSDSLLKLANNNTAGDSLDIGFYGTYNATGQKYAGLVRQAGSNFFLFKDLTTDPTANTLATGSLTAANTATLRANITGGTVSGLASAIGVADGGTGATTLTAGGILIGSGTSAVTILANTGTAGTYGNAAYLPVITTDTYGRVSSVTNTAIAIDTAAITSGTIADARLPTKGTAGTYANAAYVPVITTDAYGRVTGVTNTAISIDTGAITSGTLADARLPTKGTAGTYGNTTYLPVITTDAYGRVTAVTNTAIQSGTTSVSGIVQLTDSISSTSTTTAATPNSVKTAYDYAQSAFTKANQTAQLAFTTVSANGTSLVADANNDTLTITAASANGIFINADAGTDALDIGLRNSGVTSGTYGNNTTAVTITVDAFGRITSVSNAAISGGATLGDVLALSIALG